MADIKNVVSPHDLSDVYFDKGVNTALKIEYKFSYSIATLRTAINIPNVVFVTDSGLQGLFQYDSTDTTSADDGVNTIVNGTKRYKKISSGGSSSSSTNELLTTVKATTALTKGMPVYVSGADGTNILVAKAGNSTELTSSKTLGLISQDLSNNGIGNVTTYGLLSGLNTIGATIGDPVWLGSTAGTLLYGIANKPVAPQHLVYIGVVTRVNANNGEIFVKAQNGFEIDELHDVLIGTKNDGDVIQYEASTSLWKNKQISFSNIVSKPTTLIGYGITDAQSSLVSGTNIKTVNSNNLLGSGNISVGDALLAGTQTWTGTNTFTSPLKITAGGDLIIGTTTALSENNGAIYIKANTGGFFFQRTNGGTNLVNIKDNGNLLIGTTTDAGFKLDVNGKGRFAGLQVNGSQAGTLLSVSTPTTLGEQRFIIVTAGVAITLPTASTCSGRFYTINARSAGVTISSYIDLTGTAQTTIAMGSITIISDGTNWQRVI